MKASLIKTNDWQHLVTRCELFIAYNTNVKGALHVFQAALEVGVEKIIHTLTSEVYDTARFVPIVEDYPLQVNLLMPQQKLLSISWLCPIFPCLVHLGRLFVPSTHMVSRQSLRVVNPPSLRKFLIMECSGVFVDLHLSFVEELS